ncbi:MAG: MoaD/ThiS family protein [Anaerolineae bacterium]|nr:MoaD/ThiS family protein [Anaerolineae bacterium]
MAILIELGGVSRVLTKRREVSLSLAVGASYRQILRELGTRYPVLWGEVLDPATDTLLGANMLNLNGKLMIQPEQLDESPQAGDRLFLISVLAGG